MIPLYSMKIEFRKTSDGTISIPAYATGGSAAVDLHAAIEQSLVLQPFAKPILVPTGIMLNMPHSKMAAMILPRSGLGHKEGLCLGNTVGLIDSDYHGEVMISALNRGGAPITIEPNQRIAQLMFFPIVQVELVQVKGGFSSDRGEGGFGSTGNN